MNKIFEYLSVGSEDLGKTCSEKIKDGWEIEFIVPDTFAVYGSIGKHPSYKTSTYKVLVSKHKIESNKV